MNEEYFLTEEGAEKMRIELDDMINVQRDEIARRLRKAIDQGDLKENADYHKAKEDQGFLEGKVKEYEEILAGLKIIEQTSDGKVNIGSTVFIKEEDYPEEKFQVVGAHETNPREGRISNESPIGSAVLGHKAGDTVTVKTPAGDMKVKITKVE
jgi:transcription elongation factor GreA